MSNLCFFRLYDPKPDGLFIIEPELDKSVYDAAKPFNDDKWGIFWCPNMNRTPNEDGNITREASRVTNENINYWYCDIDEGSKQEQWERIRLLPLQPTMMVQTKKGFHLYWRSDCATVENFSLIEKRIIEYTRADKRAKDIVRLLRMWGFRHWKNPEEPYAVEIVMLNKDIRYSENQMLEAFPISEDEKKALQNSDRQIIRKYSPSDVKGDTVFDRIKAMNQQILMERLSGTQYVAGENYTFKPQRNGNINIMVDGKSTSCFINTSGNIIADKYYSNNVINWLKWYGHTPAEIYQIMRNVAPEVFK